MKKLLLLTLLILTAAFVFGCSNGDKPSDVTTAGDTGEVTTAEGTTGEIISDKEANMSKNDRDKAASMRNLNATKFSNKDFGSDIRLRLFKSSWNEPSVTPTANQHPRVLVGANSVDELKAKFESLKGTAIYDEFISLSSKVNVTDACDGDLLSWEDMQRIEAMALRYVLTDNTMYAQRAIYAIKNTILRINADADFDPYRTYGLTMYVAALVYDWCYDELTENDKIQIVHGVLNNLASKMEIGCPPSKGNVISHHTMECQLQKNYLAFAIAVYDEHPEIYDYVAGRIFDELVPAQNFMIQSGAFWEGSCYGPFRVSNLLWAQILMSKMTDGKCELYNSDDLHSVVASFPYYMLFDSKEAFFQIGDQTTANDSRDYYTAAFLGAALFDDPNFYTLAARNLIKEDGALKDHEDYVWITPTTFMALYNPTTAKSSTSFHDGYNLVNILQYPKSAVFARSKWNNTDGFFATYMTMNEFYSSSHSHMDAGSFEIYYKGLLASESGAYDGYGSTHHFGYTYQTVSTNSILVYNPTMASRTVDGRLRYSGGQSVSFESRRICPANLTEAKNASVNWGATIFGKKADSTADSYHFSYLAGDMTGHYDTSTVDSVVRHMLSVATGNADNPLVFLTYDKIDAKNASYKKTVLLHSHTLPKVSGNYVTIDNGKGKLIAQTLLTKTTATVLAPEPNSTPEAVTKLSAKSAYKVGINYINPSSLSGVRGIDYRVDFCPVKESKSDHILNVMYVTDSSNTAKPVQAKEIKTSDFEGMTIFNVTAVFAKNTNAFDGTASFTAGGSDVFVCGLKAGSWKVTVGGNTTTVTVNEGDGMLNIKGTGSVTVSYAG
ncbi:MAG: hypothetical protein KBT31_04330 [Firmicutes bacterium]|nr:hypothetical protein [Candidatus Colimorpha enterica]